MSLLSAVLQVADEVNKNEFKIQFKDISKRASSFVDNVKHFTTDVKDILVTKFIDFTPVKSLEFVNFNDRQGRLQAELDELHSLIEKILEKNSLANPKFKALYEEFVYTGDRFKYVSDLGQCSNDLELSDRLVERCQYSKAAVVLEKIVSVLEKSNNYKDYEALVYSMKDVVSFKQVKCLYKITEQWRARLKWSENLTNKGKVITVEINTSDPENLQDILNALSSSKRINVELTRFANFIIKCVMPALLAKCCILNVRENLHSTILEIEYIEESKQSDDIKIVLKNLVQFFGTIQSHIDCRWEDNRTVFSILGQLLGKEFFKMLKEYCLQNLITVDEDKLDTYLPVASEIEKLSEYLCEINFVDKDSSPLLEFTKDTHKLICERRCKVILENVRSLMKTNLQQDIIQVCTDQSSELCLDEMKMLEKDYHCRNITECPYLLPQCSISLSAKKIFQLVLEQVNIAHSASPTMANQILITIRNIFELYIALVPEIHASEINNCPLDLALFYNNCFYLAHGMLGQPWNTVYHKDFAMSLNMILCDLAQNFRRVAIIKLATFIKEQRQLIIDTIEKSELSNLSKVDSYEIDGCSAINKCVEMLRKLQRLWHSILPRAVYEKSLANLVSCLADQLVQAIFTAKENVITPDVVMALVHLYKPLIECVPKLFNGHLPSDSVSRKWSRFVEITSLLECQIFSIASKWNDSSSKLSNLFTTEEIVNLIRILFHNDKRKATVLDMIK